MVRQKKPSAFDITLTAEARSQLASDLCREIQDALDARSTMINDGGLIDLADWFYEQGRTDPKDRPFPGAADLTSYFITENVDALRSRLMKAVFGVRPFAFVEGWGQDAKKAPFVEEFTDWQVRKSGLRSELAKTIHGALIEDGYILEVSERVETRRIVEQIDVALEVGPDGQAVFANGEPALQKDDAGEFVPAQEGQPAAKIERDYVKLKRLGPQYDAISLKDFVFLPGHAKSQKQVYGYAYRFFDRLATLKEKAKDGVYEAEAVDALGENSDRDAAAIPANVDTVAYQEGAAIEKELFQVSLKRDLDKDGREEWYLLTVHLPTRTLLRCKLDTFVMKVGRPRCVPFMLFPRRNSVYGYSYSLDKLLTLAEEHTAIRNMIADRSSLTTNAPMKVLRGALWDPHTQPIGVGRVITVGEMNEVQPMQIPDVPASAPMQQNILIQAKERVGGLSDSFVGVLSQEQRTLGEQRLVAGGSAVRVDEVMGHLHAAIAEVLLLTLAIWVETLEADKKGVEAPQSVMQSLAAKGSELTDGKFTADQLKGDFAFEPYGSDSNADPTQARNNFNNGMMALANLAKVVPGLQPIFASQAVGKWVLEQWARTFNVHDRQPFYDAFQSAPPMPQASPTGGPGQMASPQPGPPQGAQAGGPPGIPPELLALLNPGGGHPSVQ
jgi:hypothetical protein